MSICIGHKNVWAGYNRKNAESKDTKSKITNYAIDIKHALTKSNNDSTVQFKIFRKLNEIATRIQKRLNDANLDRNAIIRYKSELSSIMGGNNLYTVDVYLKCCIILAKHSTDSNTKTNWGYFCINETSSIEDLRESRYSIGKEIIDVRDLVDKKINANYNLKELFIPKQYDNLSKCLTDPTTKTNLDSFFTDDNGIGDTKSSIESTVDEQIYTCNSTKPLDGTKQYANPFLERETIKVSETTYEHTYYVKNPDNLEQKVKLGSRTGLLGKKNVKSTLGTGSFGEVYHKENSTIVTKILHKPLASNDPNLKELYKQSALNVFTTYTSDPELKEFVSIPVLKSTKKYLSPKIDIVTRDNPKTLSSDQLKVAIGLIVRLHKESKGNVFGIDRHPGNVSGTKTNTVGFVDLDGDLICKITGIRDYPIEGKLDEWFGGFHYKNMLSEIRTDAPKKIIAWHISKVISTYSLKYSDEKVKVLLGKDQNYDQLHKLQALASVVVHSVCKFDDLVGFVLDDQEKVDKLMKIFKEIMSDDPTLSDDLEIIDSVYGHSNFETKLKEKLKDVIPNNDNNAEFRELVIKWFFEKIIDKLRVILEEVMPDELDDFDRKEFIEFVINWYFMINIEQIKTFSEKYKDMLNLAWEENGILDN